MSAERGALTRTGWALRGTAVLYGGYFDGTIAAQNKRAFHTTTPDGAALQPSMELRSLVH